MDVANITEVVLKLCGPVNPVADSRIDSDRLENLIDLCCVTSALIGRIRAVAESTDDHLSSVMTAKKQALEFMREHGIETDASGVAAKSGEGF